MSTLFKPFKKILSPLFAQPNPGDLTRTVTAAVWSAGGIKVRGQGAGNLKRKASNSCGTTQSKQTIKRHLQPRQILIQDARVCICVCVVVFEFTPAYTYKQVRINTHKASRRVQRGERGDVSHLVATEASNYLLKG